MDRNKKGQFAAGHRLTPFDHRRTRGRKHRPEAIEKIRLSKIGKKRGQLSAEWRRKMSEAVYKRHKNKEFGFMKGSRNPSWAGGQSAIYGSGFTGFLKRRIKERDGHVCQVCQTIKDLGVHHVDYNKQNCDPGNLITLCRSCNVKVNFDRKSWEKLFKNKIRAALSSIR